MNDYTLCCNIVKCGVPLSELAWVTRCMHVFCSNHGQAYFTSPSPQINCPICNELNLKDVDILQCEINPSDMILAGLSPEKAVSLASKSLKLWWTQIKEEQNLRVSKVKYLEKKNQEMKYTYNKMFIKAKKKFEAEVNMITEHRETLIKKIHELNNELSICQGNLQKKYKNSFGSRRIQNQGSSPNMSPQTFANIDNIIGTSSSPEVNNGFGFSFNERDIFK